MISNKKVNCIFTGLMLSALTGCGINANDPVNIDYKLPPELSHCKIFKIDSPHERYLYVMYCRESGAQQTKSTMYMAGGKNKTPVTAMTVESKEPQVTNTAQENTSSPPASEAIVVNGILYKPANR